MSRAELARFQVGEEVVVEIHPGLAGIPWVAGVTTPAPANPTGIGDSSRGH